MPRKVTAMALSILGVVRTAGSVRRMAVRALVGVRASLGSRVLFGRNDRRLACLLHHRDKGRSRWAPFANITVDVDFPVYPRGFTLCAISTLRKGLSRAKLPFFRNFKRGRNRHPQRPPHSQSVTVGTSSVAQPRSEGANGIRPSPSELDFRKATHRSRWDFRGRVEANHINASLQGDDAQATWRAQRSLCSFRWWCQLWLA